MGFKIKKECLVKARLRKKDTKIIIPDGVKSVGEYAFAHKENIQEVSCPNSVETIKDCAFEYCSFLEKFDIRGSLESIGQAAFMGCYRLKEIKFPDTVKNIGANAFEYCNSLKKIVIPPLVNTIEYRCFEHCVSLEEVDFSNVEYIGSSAFEACKNLKFLKFSSLKKIDSCAFAWCLELEKVEFLGSINEIGQSAFSQCCALEEVKFSNSIERLPKNCFSNCTRLKKINLLEGLTFMGAQCFFECSELEQISLPHTLKEIGPNSFELCKSLKEIELPSSLTVISMETFLSCYNLNKVIINEGTEIIKNRAFGYCSSLEEIEIPSTIKEIEEYAFFECNKLNKIKLNNFNNLLEDGIVSVLKDFNYFYLDKSKKEVILSKNELNDMDNYEMFYVEEDNNLVKSSTVFLKMLTDKNNINKYKNTVMIMRLIKNYINCDVNELISKIGNTKEYNGLIKRLDKSFDIDKYNINYFELYKLCNLLGAFSDNQTNRQKACEFVFNIFEKRKITFDILHSVFESLKYKEFNEELAEFIMDKNNFDELLKLETEKNGYICRICNNYSQIKEYGRSNRGSQYYRKVTIEMCKAYLANVNFDNVSNENVDISNTISSYTHNQETFDLASEIRKEYLKLREKKKIHDHILNEELKEDVFEIIRKEKKNIRKGIGNILSNLNEISNDMFSYEFLSKYDSKNFILGKYCCCCSHLEGAGKGIMKASILHPDCQNLVIKNKLGLIVAKSTLYINRKQGYGVFNNVEVNINLTEKEKDAVYEKYIKAINAFAEKYNEINKNNPIKQINVGMGLNDLEKQIFNYHQRSEKILESIDYKDYGGTWSGDWKNEQYILYVNKEVESKDRKKVI